MLTLKVFILIIITLAGCLAKPGPKSTDEKQARVPLYILSDRAVSSYVANAQCSTLGLVAVSIEDAAKNSDVTHFMNSFNVGSAWTSGNDLDNRNEYYWNWNKPFTYFNWLNGAPLTDESCRCVAFVSGVHNDCGEQTSCSGWTVEPCDSLRRVICELPPEMCENKVDA